MKEYDRDRGEVRNAYEISLEMPKREQCAEENIWTEKG
jgi:hypothetical protein